MAFIFKRGPFPLALTLASSMVSFSIHASRKLLMAFHRAQKRITHSLSPSQKFGGVTSLLQYIIRKQPLKSIASQIHRILPTPMVAKKVNFRDAFLRESSTRSSLEIHCMYHRNYCHGTTSERGRGAVEEVFARKEKKYSSRKQGSCGWLSV